MKTGKRFLAGIFCLLMVVICVVGLTACESECEHKWSEWKTTSETSCTEPTEKQRSCSLCDEVETKTFDAEGHKWDNATCEAPKTCSGCKATEGAALGHTWDAATCEVPKTCSVCAKTEGEALGHSWKDASCEAPKTCETCHKTEGEALAHTWDAATCEAPKTCSACKATEGEALGHSWVGATCETPKTCSVCKKTEGNALGHSYTYTSNGDGTHTKTCANDATDTVVENCSGGTASCTDKAICDHCKTAYGDEPEHNWGTGTPVSGAGCLTGGVTRYTCSKCQQTKDETIDPEGHSYEHTVTPPTCTENGYTTHVCSKCSDTYVDSYVDAKGHSWDREKDCDNGRECTSCHVKEDALGHNYAEVTEKATEADCKSAATKTYKCDRCQHEYTEEIGAPKGHDTTGVTPKEVLKEGTTCEYVKYYECKDCHEDIEGEHIHRHSYVASISKDATCKDDGEKTLKCSLCNDIKTEPIEKNETGHNYVEGTVTDGKRTDTCKHCGATKQVTVYEGTSTGSTNASEFKDTEIELNDANISLDAGVIDKIGDKNVTLSADKLDASDLEGKVPADKLAQVGDSPIYNFTINDGEQNISKFDDNWVTITLPYTLSEGEDVDSIAIWFIDDEGNLESIKATYNNGYVTFKTNHFSYYTVTKLTPKERCELYGHNYTTTTVEGTCTSDGYELKVCVRCHDTVKTITSVAEGHIYTAKTTEATCTQSGQTVYTCACGHSYTVRHAATGHSWTLKEHLDASCTAAGYDKYSCDKCGSEYFEDYAQIAHKLTSTVVAPTCDTYGYTEHKCDNCDYSYIDSTVLAKGHSYEASWSWSDDYGTATLTLTCKTDSSHVVTKIAEITEIKTDPTCTAKGKIEYGAVAVVNGAAYRDTKSVELDKLAHTYSEEFKYDASKHWHECKCGAKTESVAHQYNDGTETKKPTCSEAGEKLLECECGHTKKVSVPATGEHTLVNGVCTGCGKVENVCDHTKLEYKVINFADYGCCGGVAIARSCECGEVMEVDFDSSFLDIECDVDDYEESEEEDEDNGIYIETMSAKCPDCGLEIYAKYVESYKNCIEKYSLEYEFKMNGEVILHFVMEEEEEYHDDSRQTVDLTEHGACGGTVSLYICDECGLVTNYSGSDFACNGTTKTEEIVDENGNTHSISIYECADCGLKQIMEVWEEKISDCEIIYHGILKLTVGDKVIADIEISESDEEHEYEIEFEYFGEEGRCEDGYKIKYSCSVCGDSYETARVGHRFWTYGEIPFDDAITCGGSIYASTCEICGIVGYVEDIDIACDLSKTEMSTVIDDDGVEHMIASAECPTCGAKFECDMWVEVISVCESTTHMEYTIKDSEGNILHEFDITEHESDHEYEREYQLQGETCDDGYTVTEHCDKCGEESTWSSSGHRSEYEQINIEEIGGCGGFINASMCEICGEVTYFYYNSYCNIYNDSQKTEEIVGEDGLVHYIVTSTCSNCSLTYIEESWQTEMVDCSCTRYGRLCIMKGEEVLFDLTRSETYAEHDYERTYKLHGVSCEDGYDVIDRCKSCGYTENWKSSGHRGDYDEINLGDYLPCGGWAEVSYCEICNETTHFNENSKCHWTYEGLTEDGYDKEVCQRCGAEKLFKYSQSERDGNCTILTSYEYKYFLNDELVLELIVSEKREQHNFEYSFKLDGESCEDGVQINTLCLDCGKGYSGYSSWHSLYDKQEIDLSEHGACGGAIHVRECPCGEYKEINIDHDCRMETLFEDKTDSGYSYVSRCAECGLTVTRENGSETVGCYVQWYESVTVVIGDKAIFGPERYITSKEDRHNYEYTYFLQGESCKDGVITVATCKDCGESYETESYWCNEMLIAEYRFDEHGACGYGSISVYGCPCGAQSYVNFDCGCAYESEWDRYVDGNGINHEVETLFCRSCGLQIVRDVYGEKNGCEVLYYTIYTVTIGDKTVVDGLMTQNGISYNHNYETSFEMYGKSCEDGVLVHRVCSDCGEEYTYDISYHETFIVEGYDFNDYGACGKDGYLYIYSCACGERGHVESSDGCARYMGEETVIDGNGVTHYVTTYSCPKCGLHITVDSYDEKDGCYRYNYNTYTVKVGDTVIVDKLQCLYSSYGEHDYEQEVKLMGESCEDGVFVNSTCKTCGYTTSEEYYWHKEIGHAQISFEGNGCCDARLEIYGCACGHNGYANINFNGKQKRSTYDDENGVQHILYTYSCNSCGIVITRDVYTLVEGCYTVSYSTYRMTMNGEVILNDVRLIEDRSEKHNYEYSFNMYGESCYDGYDAIRTCRDCGHTYMSSYSWHELFPISIYEFSEYGACGGSMAIFACPCGYECTLKYEGDGCKFSDGKEETYFDENGVEHKVNSMTCDICGLTIVADTYSVKENCQVKAYNTYTVYIGDTVIVNNLTSLYSSYEQHDYDCEVQMMGESCEDGVYVRYFCLDCGYGYEDSYWSHWTYEKELVELSEHGACEGKIVVSECLCGDVCDVNISFCFDMWNENQYVDENGVKHNVTVYTCKSCGLRVQYDSYTLRDPGKCVAVTYTSIAVSVGDKAIGVYESVYKQSESHDLLYSAELVDGAEQCGQGVVVTEYCRDCDYRYTNTHYYHYEIDLNKIDLSELGATCGGYAVERGCACGKYHNVDIYGESNCLFEDRFVGSLEGFEGSSWVYIYTCAVTDPACGFKVMLQNYYKAESGSCVEYGYYTWLLGYNEETGEYKYEITYKRDNDYRTHHSYVASEIETVEDGFNVKVNKRVCSVCGSYEETKNYYSNNRRVKYTIVSEYFHEKADCIYQNEIYEYTYYSNRDGKQDYYISREYNYYKYSSGRINWNETLYEEDHNYLAPFGENAVYSKRTHSSSNGENFIQEVAYTYYKGYDFVLFEHMINDPDTENEHWYRYEYTYDFTNGCLRTYVYTNSKGEKNEETSENHRSYKHSYEGGSCTQDSICTVTCMICGHVIDSYPEVPYNHEWYYNYNTGIYECGRCGLENANGASGSIVMEDMSEKYGEGVNYVVGYWNADHVKYTYYVSLVLRGVDGDERIVEVECTEAEDIRAYLISKEAVEKIAAENGLTAEDYDVKFTFVPEGADGNYDYAIVFTSETAAKK